MPYEERYVAFVDILGFSEIVKNSIKGNEKPSFDELVNILGKISERDHEIDSVFGDDFKFQTFSDSIIMSDRISIGGLFQITSAVQDLAIELLKVGLLMRGGIAKGRLHHDANVVFGPAFLEAYRLESSIAKFPRIILSRDVYADMKRDPYHKERVVLASDGPPHLHVLHRFTKRKAPKGLERLFEREREAGVVCQPQLQALLDASIYEPRYYEKLSWFSQYWNATVDFDADEKLKPITFPNTVRS